MYNQLPKNRTEKENKNRFLRSKLLTKENRITGIKD